MHALAGHSERKYVYVTLWCACLEMDIIRLKVKAGVGGRGWGGHMGNYIIECNCWRTVLWLAGENQIRYGRLFGWMGARVWFCHCHSNGFDMSAQCAHTHTN